MYLVPPLNSSLYLPASHPAPRPSLMTNITAILCTVLHCYNVERHAGKTARFWKPPGFAAGPRPRPAKSPAELRTLPAKFANLGKGQGIPRPVGIGSGMQVEMAGKPTATGCGVPREPTSERLLFPPPCLPVKAQSKVQSHSQLRSWIDDPTAPRAPCFSLSPL